MNDAENVVSRVLAHAVKHSVQHTVPVELTLTNGTTEVGWVSVPDAHVVEIAYGLHELPVYYRNIRYVALAHVVSARLLWPQAQV